MLSIEEQNILYDFYLKLENIEKVISFIQPDISDWSKASSELRLKVWIETNSLTKLDSDDIRQRFKEYKDSVIEYLNERIETTRNYLLKARYNHFLYCLTRNNQYGNQAIEEYQRTLLLYINNTKQENIYLNFQDVFEIIISLTKSTKYKTEELKEQVHNYLKDFKIHGRIKTYIIDSISETILFKVKELDYIPELCCALAKKEIKHRFIKINLQLGLGIARKLENTIMQRTINELLGDNEYKNIKPYDGKPESMLIPHQNRSVYKKIILYYKNAHNVEKQDKAILEYNANKRNCKWPKINVIGKAENEEEKQKMLEEVFYSIIDSSTQNIIYQLVFGNKLLFISDESLEKHADENKNRILFQEFDLSCIDLNNNEKSEKVRDFLRFELYYKCLPIPVNLAFNIIITSSEAKKLSYKNMAKVLCSDLFFGQELFVTRNGHNLPYNWFSMIDIGLKSFFEQCSLLIKNKQPDWRFSIDFLSLKFEGILRDMVGLIDGVITKVDKDGNTTDMLLDDLLRSDSIKKVFNKDDINLFQYTFTSKGCNIRNYVAHSFYKPQDYTRFNTVLVLLCVLRLAKFNYTRIQNQKTS